MADISFLRKTQKNLEKELSKLELEKKDVAIEYKNNVQANPMLTQIEILEFNLQHQRELLRITEQQGLINMQLNNIIDRLLGIHDHAEDAVSDGLSTTAVTEKQEGDEVTQPVAFSVIEKSFSPIIECAFSLVLTSHPGLELILGYLVLGFSTVCYLHYIWILLVSFYSRTEKKSRR